ncbi:LacI family DNA-binding transcriptional regulator [Paracidobacterium acidisoli]|nr:LacI family DNA-binding transcriptional regulator [Paracidobacterium acidisoli]MBT9332199.1 LacI family transcriptional regulator [Paracidobacterium acidisoli]
MALQRPQTKEKKIPDQTGIRQVAKRAGVGIGSVSRVFSGAAGVSDQMRARVLRAAEIVGYSPNMLAQALRRQKTQSVGFVVSDIANPLVSSIIHGAEAVLSAAGYSLLLTNSGGEPAVDARRIRLLQQRRVDGLILLPAVEDDPAMLAALGASGIPLVVIDRSLPDSIEARYVYSDHYTGVGQAARHLLELGHRSLGVIVGLDVRPSRERIRAVTDAYRERKMKPKFLVDAGPLSAEHGAATMKRWLSAPNPPTAVILGGNQLLVGALETIRSRNLRLGRDLSLVVCDDVPLGRLFDPPISTVMRDTDLMGQTAARFLLDAISQPEQAASIAVLPTWYVPRVSCGAPVTR